jgi:hypothetical protein
VHSYLPTLAGTGSLISACLGSRADPSMRRSEGSRSPETVKLLSPSPRHLGSTLGPRKAQSMVRGPGECAFYVNRVGEVWGAFWGTSD